MGNRRAEVCVPIRQAWHESRGGLIAVVVFSAFINVLKFAMPLYLLQVLDRVPASRSVETLVMLTIFAVLAVVSGVALDAVRRRMLTRWGVWIEERFGETLFQDGFAETGLGQSATAQQSLRDLAWLRTFVTKSAAPWLDIVWAPVFVLGVYFVHPLLGLIVLATIVALIGVAVLQEIATREPRRVSKHASDDADEIVSAAERNREAVGALTMIDNLAQRWRRSAVTRWDERERSESRVASFIAIRQGLYHCLRIGVLAVGVWLMLLNLLTLGGIFAARVMAGFAFKTVDRAVRHWRALKDAHDAYRRIKTQLSGKKDASASVPTSHSDAVLVIDGLTFRYQSQRDHIVDRLNLVVEPGEVLLIIGPAATGKTTLSRLLSGVLPPRYGQIRLADTELARLPPEMRARLIGYLQQDTRLFNGTVRDNIARMGEGDFDDVVAAAKFAGIHETVVRLSDGYDTEISEESLGLSGSERKRIALARAFYGGPQLIVLDEPEANLDRDSRRALAAAIKELKNRRCTIVVTSEATRARRLALLADKVLILGGKAPEIVDGGTYVKLADTADTSSKEPSRGRLRSVT